MGRQIGSLVEFSAQAADGQDSCIVSADFTSHRIQCQEYRHVEAAEHTMVGGTLNLGSTADRCSELIPTKSGRTQPEHYAFPSHELIFNRGGQLSRPLLVSSILCDTG